MNESLSISPPKYREGIFSAISLGAFLILVGVVFATTPNLFDKIVAFFNNFDIVPVSGIPIYLPAPTAPWAHAALYSAVTQLSLGLGILQILILALRLIAHSPLNKTAETVGNLVFWCGTNYLVSTLLNETTTLRIWFAFWSGIIVLIGVSLIIRAVILLAQR